jgi:uncharacterized circularly permuted ATP-grasp superfamily protein/uncharacterized alpha-E superfamily protein
MTPPAASTTSSLFKGYASLAGRYDEALASDGSVRPAWQAFARSLGTDPLGTLRSANESARRAIVEQDVSLNIYSGENSDAIAWPLDVVPLLLGSDDWTTLAAGLRQRAQVFNTLLQDLYGPQKLLRQGLLPAALGMANPHFLRACSGLGKSRQPFVHTYAADVARSPDGRWWVLQDRLESPSGLGYALQNRIIVRQVLPNAFKHAPVSRLYRFFRDFRVSLDQLQSRTESPRIVLLSPGPANESYYEHAYLARHLGCPLVEGGDLSTRDGRVFLRTVGGLREVSVIVRRLDSEFCDPLELDEHSLLGVPGLVHAAQSGRVAIANQMGGRAVESTALLSFLPSLCRQIAGEDLLIPSAATWWGGQRAARDYILENLHGLVIKPTYAGPGASATRYGALLDAKERTALAAEISANPSAYCGQERVLLGTTPAWDPATSTLRPMPFVTRIYLSWHDGEYHAMPGGLSRFNTSGEDAIVSLQSGSVSKDTWVLSDEQSDEPPVMEAATINTNEQRHGAATPSRLADNLFWLGRYLERTGQLTRLLSKLEPLLRDEIAVLDPGVLKDTINFLLFLQDSSPANTGTLEQKADYARRIACDLRQSGSIANNLNRLARILEASKLRLPPDAWRLARELRAASKTTISPAAIQAHLANLEGVTAEIMVHDTGWRFLELGRRIERATHTLQLMRALLQRPSVGTGPTEFRLQTCLHLADSLFTYRSNFNGTFHPASVMSWMLAESENPRGLRYQVERITEHLATLPDELAPRSVETLRTTVFRLLSSVRLADMDTLAATPEQASELWNDQLALLADVSNQLAHIYFAHTDGETVT